jgi:hypothetical protein
MEKGVHTEDNQKIDRRSSAISRREEKEDQRTVQRLAKEGGRVLDEAEDQNVMRVSTTLRNGNREFSFVFRR